MVLMNQRNWKGKKVENLRFLRFYCTVGIEPTFKFN